MAIISTFVENTQYLEDLKTRQIKIENELDFSATNVASADVVEALKIPADCLITDVHVIVKTAEGGTLTFDVGDGADPNGFDDAVDGNATAGSVTSSIKGTDAYGIGRAYTANDTIDLTMDNAADAASIVVVASGMNLNTDLA